MTSPLTHPEIHALAARCEGDYRRFVVSANEFFAALRHLAATDAVAFPVKLRTIVDCVSEEFGVSATTLQSKSRPAEIALPRHIAMYLASELIPKITQREIGNAFHRTPSAVGHAITAVLNRSDTDATVSARVEALRARCSQRLENIDLPIFAGVPAGKH